MNDEPEGMAKLLADIDSGEFARRLGHALWLEKVREVWDADAVVEPESSVVTVTYTLNDTMRPEGPHGRNTSLGTDPPTA